MILYLISSFKGSKSGKGGHYYSLMHIAEAVSSKKSVAIVNIGTEKSAALEQWKGECHFINVSILGQNKALNEIEDLCKKYKPEIIHAFDKFSGYFARRLFMVINIPWILTKCGGPNPSQKRFYQPSKYYPKAQHQIVFHKDDYDWFREKLFKPLNIYLIPSRVNVKFEFREESAEINSFFENSDLKLIRIARISDLHYSSIIQSINFVKKLRDHGIKAKLAIIGNVASNYIYNELSRIAGEETAIFISNKFTRKASDFLPLADIAIGTGRSFMEGCAAECVMMAPVKGSKYPALVTPENIAYFEYHNFSGRTPQSDEVNPERDILHYCNEILSNKHLYSNDMQNIFNKRYNVTKAVERYLSLYSSISSKKTKETNVVDLFLHHLWVNYTLVKSRPPFI